MAPGRRKGTTKNSSCSSSVSRTQWKVGDLVLAKVKGFPPWPATVSEPEKWGYSTDWKKVLVYFFGTKQIGFCNPADVEAFTEEKKKSLLGKRQGKGSDFVRAVEEIIKSYDETQKQNAVVECASADKKIVHHKEKVSNGIDLNLLSRDVPSDLENSCLLEERLTLFKSGEIPVTSNKTYLLEESSPKELDSSVYGHVVDKRERSRDDACVGQRAYSSFIDDHKPKTNFPNDGSKRKYDLTQKSQDISSSRETRLGILNDSCTSEEGISYALIESEEVGNEDHRVEQSNIYVDHEKEILPKTRTEPQKKTIFLKRKKKATRKNFDNITEHCDKWNKEKPSTDLSSRDILKSSHSSETLNGLSQRAVGDEHLPLVKRARVRMSKIPIEENVLYNVANVEEKSAPKDLICSNNGATSETPLEEKENISTSPSNNCSGISEKLFLSGEAKIYHIRSTSGDGESTLPPSKRLHRALEAMSANSSQLDGSYTDATQSFKTPPEEDNTHSEVDNTYSETRRSGEESNKIVSLNSVSELSSCLTTSTTETLVGSSPDAKNRDIVEKECSSLRKDCLGVSRVTENYLESKIRCCLSDDCQNSKPRSHANDPLYFSIHEQSVCSDVFTGKSSVVMREEGRRDLSEASSGHLNKTKATGHIHEDKSNVPQLKNWPHLERQESASAKEVGFSYVASEGSTTNQNSQCIKSFRSPTIEVTGDESMIAISNEVRESESALDTFHLRTMPIKVLIAAANAKRYSTSCSLSNITDEKKHTSSDAVSTVFSPQKQLQIQKISSSHPSSFTVPSNDRSLHLQRSPDSSTNRKILMSGSMTRNDGKYGDALDNCSKSCGKIMVSVEASEVFKSFENMLMTLSRTKDSIGCATRVAIDCAKHGIASNVIELLLHKLENEPRLHRKVDLLFLVDSIAQCSKSQKGDVEETYPFAVQKFLSRLLSAAAPPGDAARENRKQCLKVLRIWLERKILPESILRPHIRELDFADASATTSGTFSYGTSRSERAFNDPVREMEGMLVDEYGSNTSFQIPGFFVSRIPEDEDDGCASDEKCFEAVTPEHNPEIPCVQDITAKVKHPHILEDVDGELEMEDVSPSEITSNSTHQTDISYPSTCEFDQGNTFPFVPPLPKELPPSPPPLPSSPPPVAPARPIPPIMTITSHTFDSQFHTVTHNYLLPPPICKPNSVASLDEVCQVAPDFQDPSQCIRPMMISPYGKVSGPPSTSRNDEASRTYHLEPPSPMVSDQFSYIQANPKQSGLVEMESAFTRRFWTPKKSPENENFYDSKRRCKFFQRECEEVHNVVPSGGCTASSDKIEAPFPLRPYCHLPRDPTLVSNNERFSSPCSFRYQSSVHSARTSSENRFSRETGGYWRPR